MDPFTAGVLVGIVGTILVLICIIAGVNIFDL